MAVASGIVIHKVVDPGNQTNGGNEIRIDHNGFVSGYKHMKPGSHAHLSIGDVISQGDPVGRVAATGTSAIGNHLHLDIYQGGVRIDPHAFILANFGGDMPTTFTTSNSTAITLTQMSWANVEQFTGLQWPRLPYSGAADNIAELVPSASIFDVVVAMYVSNLPAGHHVGVRLGVWSKEPGGAISGQASMTFEGDSQGRARGNFSGRAAIDQNYFRLCVQAYSTAPAAVLNYWGVSGLAW